MKAQNALTKAKSGFHSFQKAMARGSHSNFRVWLGSIALGQLFIVMLLLLGTVPIYSQRSLAGALQNRYEDRSTSSRKTEAPCLKKYNCEGDRAYNSNQPIVQPKPSKLQQFWQKTTQTITSGLGTVQQQTSSVNPFANPVPATKYVRDSYGQLIPSVGAPAEKTADRNTQGSAPNPQQVPVIVNQESLLDKAKSSAQTANETISRGLGTVVKKFTCLFKDCNPQQFTLPSTTYVPAGNIGNTDCPVVVPGCPGSGYTGIAGNYGQIPPPPLPYSPVSGNNNSSSPPAWVYVPAGNIGNTDCPVVVPGCPGSGFPFSSDIPFETVSIPLSQEPIIVNGKWVDPKTGAPITTLQDALNKCTDGSTSAFCTSVLNQAVKNGFCYANDCTASGALHSLQQYYADQAWFTRNGFDASINPNDPFSGGFDNLGPMYIDRSGGGGGGSGCLSMGDIDSNSCGNAGFGPPRTN